MNLISSLCIFAIVYIVNASPDEEDAIKDRNKVCYHAQICVHSAVEKCGVNSHGKYRRFYDSCDITEYNCLRDTDYEKTDMKYCEKMPPLTRRKK